MDTGTFTGFEVERREPGIAWLRFNSPERLNGMTTAIKRDLIEAVLCGSDDIPLEDLRKLEAAVQADINEIRARNTNLEDEE